MQIRVAVLAAAFALPSLSCPSKPTPTPTPSPEPTATLTPTPTPSPEPPPVLARLNGKIDLHYYSDHGYRYGTGSGYWFDSQAVALRTSARLDRFGAIRNAGDSAETDEVLVARMAVVLDQIPRGMRIVLGLDYRWVSTGSDGGPRVAGLIFQMIRDRGRWPDIFAVEIYDEPEGGAAEVQADGEEVLAIAASLGLAPKPLGLTSTPAGILGRVAAARGLRGLRSPAEGILEQVTTSDYVVGDSMAASRVPEGMTRRPRPATERRSALAPTLAGMPGWYAPVIKWVALELYAPLQLAWGLDEVVAGWPLVSLSDQIAAVRALRPDMMFAVVIMGYGRNIDTQTDWLGWRNMHTLALQNQQSFVACLDRQEVLWAAIFSCGRTTCTCDQTYPQVGIALRPVHAAARARIDNPTAPWPALPMDPILKYPARLAPRSIYLKQRLGDSAEVGEARRWGVIVINKLRVFGQCKGTNVECEADNPTQFYGAKVAKWAISGGGTLSDQHYNETQGWAQAVTIGDTPAGSKIVVTASLTVGTHTASWRGEWVVKPAGYVAYGKCDGGPEKKAHQRVPIWVNDATGEARCAQHGGAW